MPGPSYYLHHQLVHEAAIPEHLVKSHNIVAVDIFHEVGPLPYNFFLVFIQNLHPLAILALPILSFHPLSYPMVLLLPPCDLGSGSEDGAHPDLWVLGNQFPP